MQMATLGANSAERMVPPVSVGNPPSATAGAAICCCSGRDTSIAYRVTTSSCIRRRERQYTSHQDNEQQTYWVQDEAVSVLHENGSELSVARPGGDRNHPAAARTRIRSTVRQ